MRRLGVNADSCRGHLDAYAIKRAQEGDDPFRVIVRKNSADPQTPQGLTFDLDG